MICDSTVWMPIDTAYLITIVTAILTLMAGGVLGYHIRSLGQ